MAKSVMADIAADDDATIQAEIERMLEDVKRDREDMKRAQERIDCLKAQTRAALARMEAD